MIKHFISTLLARFQSEDEEGQTLVEYGLLLALIAIIVIVALLFLGPIVSEHLQQRRRRTFSVSSSDQRYETPGASAPGRLSLSRAPGRDPQQYHRRD